MFEPFHRATHVGNIAGAGLRRVITKDAVEMHGDTIAVKSLSDIGTTVTIRLPVKFETENNNEDDLRY